MAKPLKTTGRPRKELLPDGPLEAQARQEAKRESPFWRDLMVLLASKLYAAERLSSERAAKLAGVNHVEFLLGLGFYKVFPLQAELNELEHRDD
jgi:hypothetical protein